MGKEVTKQKADKSSKFTCLWLWNQQGLYMPESSTVFYLSGFYLENKIRKTKNKVLCGQQD